jgi:hypothetical protein
MTLARLSTGHFCGYVFIFSREEEILLMLGFSVFFLFQQWRRFAV